MWASRINYLTLIIFAAIGLLFYNNYMLLFVLIVLCCLPLASFIIMKTSKKKIDVNIETDKTLIGKNIPVNVCFDVKNNSIIPVENFTLSVKIYNSFFENEQTYEIIIPSTPFSDRKATIEVSSIYCGRMVIEVTKVLSYDLLGMFKFTIPFDKKHEIMVIPYDVVELEELPISTTGNSDDEELQFVKGDDVSQISQIRNYIPGDKLQNIHWKLSAKEEEIQVKEFSLPYSDDIIFLMELYVNKEIPEDFDEMLEKMYAVSRFLIKQVRKFSLVWYEIQNEEFKFIEINNNDELIAAIIELFFAKTIEQNEFSYEIYRKIYSESKGTVIYLSDMAAKPNEGQNIDINSERVVLTCLY